MDDWAKRIIASANELEKGKIGFTDFLALYYEAAKDPKELKRFVGGLSQVIRDNTNPYIVRECVVLAGKVTSSTLDEAVEKLEKSNRFARSPMKDGIAHAIAAYHAIL